jgi:hypothetical protein
MFIHDVKTNNKNIQFKKFTVFVLINAEKEFSVSVKRDRKAYCTPQPGTRTKMIRKVKKTIYRLDTSSYSCFGF